MAKAKIKEAYKEAVIGFNGSGLPLGQRDDLDALALLAISSQDPSLLQLFDVLPTAEDLKKSTVEKALSKRPLKKRNSG